VRVILFFLVCLGLFRLTFGGEILENEKTISNYSITSGSTIHMVFILSSNTTSGTMLALPDEEEEEEEKSSKSSCFSFVFFHFSPLF